MVVQSDATKFVIYAPSYSEKIGGVIALHTLCARLNELGYSAALWPWFKPVGWQFGEHARYALRLGWRFSRGPFSNPIATARDLEQAVVIYPEVTAGNPLGAKRVVRWLLHRPGFHTGVVDFGPDDSYFYWDEAFNDPTLAGDSAQLLHITHMHPAYRQTNFGARQGACVLFRKGLSRPHNQHPADAIVVDDYSHEDLAAVFNQCATLYSYDAHCFYTVYAALCGCVPVIVPEPGVTREQWHPRPQDRLGLAYGSDEIEQARAERPALVAHLARARLEQDEMVRGFVATCRQRWHGYRSNVGDYADAARGVFGASQLQAAGTNRSNRDTLSAAR